MNTHAAYRRAALTPCLKAGASAPQSGEANKALVRRYVEMWNTGKMELADRVLAPTWVDHAHPEVTDLDSVKHVVAQIRTAFPDKTRL